jgi:hypothetical protein
VAVVWAFLGWERIRLARRLDAEGNEQKQDNNFTVNGAHAVSATEISVRELMTLCLQESERRFSGYDLSRQPIPVSSANRMPFLSTKLGYGSGSTCWRRLRDWQKAAVWKRLHELLLAKLREAGELDFSRAAVDSSSVRAVGAGEKLVRTPRIGRV